MKIVLYSTNCPKCVVLEKKLNSKQISCDVIMEPEALLEKGYMTAPMLEVDGVMMDFSEANKWINNIK